MKHLDLFSGIGGWGLASGRVFAGREIVSFVEIDNFCQAVLRKNYPNVPIHEDIKNFNAKPFRGIDLLTGSPPCQSVSHAGKRLGKKDDRWLWDEAIRVLGECKPTWAIFENVYGLISHEGGVAFNEVLTGMENKGYEVWPIVLPACAVNAPHRRDRVWFVANRNASNDLGRGSRSKTNGKGMDEDEQTGKKPRSKPTRCRKDDWNKNWLEVATRLCTLDDGLPNGLPRPKGWRNAALKACGNSIVPQVAEMIMNAISCTQSLNLPLSNIDIINQSK